MIKVGIIGCGYWGPKLIRNFYEIPQSEISIISDLSRERLNTIAQLYGSIATTQDYQQLLDSDVEAVCIATPIRTHYKLVKEALLAGKHVLVEKPLAASTEEALELCILADNLGLTLMVGHTFEYNPAVEKLRSIIQSGELGEIFYIDAARLNLGLFQKDINVLWDLAPHDFSIISFLLDGAEPDFITARGASHIIPNIYDVVFSEAYFPNNVLVNVHVSWLDPCKVRRVTVVGSQKMAVFNDVAEAEKIRIYDKKVTIPQETGTGEFINFTPSYFTGDITIPRIPAAEPLKIECQHFLDCIATGNVPRSSGWVGLKIVRMLEAADRACKAQPVYTHTVTQYRPTLVANGNTGA
ncbi:MAG: oxidoreductase domain protein [Chloroflexi bacterium]|nr:oxidoreductase domain protein [Chloroflexota bacterium]